MGKDKKKEKKEKKKVESEEEPEEEAESEEVSKVMSASRFTLYSAFRIGLRIRRLSISMSSASPARWSAM